VGDRIVVTCDLISDGHDLVAGALVYRRVGASAWERARLEAMPNDRYQASFSADALGLWEFSIEAWIDVYATWKRALERKVEARQDVALELLVGAGLLAAASARTTGVEAKLLGDAARRVGDAKGAMDGRISAATHEPIVTAAGRAPDLSFATRLEVPLRVTADPPLARFSSWYEMFPRSAGKDGKHGTLRDVAERLAYVEALGFDVLYLPPIHPIGRSYRKGKNNALTATEDDVGSPWAIGSAEGGHKAVHPLLGTVADLRALVTEARSRGIEVALDIAFQASPDHPYVKEHPEWFLKRPDGSVQYAENPPKKYQDVYPFDFEGPAWESLWVELTSIFTFWCEQGVRVFRVDNPHTKSLRFWEFCIAEVKAKYPEAIFLAEAFTRPKLMYALAKGGFSQSYTYFAWRTTQAEFRDYLTEITRPPVSHFYRPNFWPQTPDILPEHLQFGGRATFLQRLILAATLSSNYGIYGPAFELLEKTARPGSEEYLDNEKFQLRAWDLDKEDSLREEIALLNRIRRDNPALQDNRITFHTTTNDQLLAFSKRSGPGPASASMGAAGSVVLVVVNLDASHKHAGWIDLDLGALGIAPGESFQVHDLLLDARYEWQGGRGYVEIDPGVMPASIFKVRHRVRSEHDFEYFL
jgi:starch synthase (maltosyl-transferring)